MKSTNYEAPHYADFSNFPLLFLRRSKWFPQHPVLLFSDTLDLCFPLNVRDQLSHPYRTIGTFFLR